MLSDRSYDLLVYAYRGFEPAESSLMRVPDVALGKTESGVDRASQQS